MNAALTSNKPRSKTAYWIPDRFHFLINGRWNLASQISLQYYRYNRLSKQVSGLQSCGFSRFSRLQKNFNIADVTPYMFRQIYMLNMIPQGFVEKGNFDDFTLNKPTSNDPDQQNEVVLSFKR